jgi:hypothetical protein
MRFTFKDTDGRKWKALVRGCYQGKLKSTKTLLAHKQKAADEQRKKGRPELANAIENQTIVRWASDSGIFSWKERIIK